MLGGSLPQGFAASDVVHLMKYLKKRKIGFIVDCPGSVMRDVIEGEPLLIKPNLDEFTEMTQRNPKNLMAVENLAKKLIDRIPFVCVSSVDGGTLLVTRSGSYFGRIPEVKIESTVGAGDSMVGAMAAQIYRKNFSAEDLLRWSLAASAATLSHPGTAMGGAREMRRLYKETSVRRLR